MNYINRQADRVISAWAMTMCATFHGLRIIARNAFFCDKCGKFR